MLKPVALLFALILSVTLLAQTKNKTWPVAKTYVGTSAPATIAKFKKEGFNLTYSDEIDGMTIAYYTNENALLIHPEYGEDAQMQGVIHTGNKVLAYLFTIGETNADDTLTAYSHYLNFEKALKADGFTTDRTEKEEGVESRYFQNAARKQKVKAQLFINENDGIQFISITVYDARLTDIEEAF